MGQKGTGVAAFDDLRRLLEHGFGISVLPYDILFYTRLFEHGFPMFFGTFKSRRKADIHRTAENIHLGLDGG